MRMRRASSVEFLAMRGATEPHALSSLEFCYVAGQHKVKERLVMDWTSL
jgi:hypothetical protein